MDREIHHVGRYDIFPDSDSQNYNEAGGGGRRSRQLENNKQYNIQDRRQQQQ